VIRFNDVTAQWREIEEKALPRLKDFLRKGPYILGDQVKNFEQNFAAAMDVKYALGVSNGTDGLKLAVQALEAPPGTPVIMPANAYIADALAAACFHLPIILVDCDQYYQMDTHHLQKILKSLGNNKSILIVVHLYGQASDMTTIKNMAHNSYIIEDCSQAHGASIRGELVGGLGDIGVFSCYPTKNLGAIGDAGVITTNNERFYDKLVMLRNYGTLDKSDYIHMGWNHRLDDIQALFLDEKLPYMGTWNEKRTVIARLYDDVLGDIEEIVIPKEAPYNDGSTYHLYPIRTKKRDALQEYLATHEIPTLVHYPLPIHKMTLFRHLDREDFCLNAVQYSQEVLSIPMHAFLHIKDAERVAQVIKEFFTYENL
jgi:dTDP-4-amino-4,6-dideoxygalactose transaminase